MPRTAARLTRSATGLSNCLWWRKRLRSLTLSSSSGGAPSFATRMSAPIYKMPRSSMRSHSAACAAATAMYICGRASASIAPMGSAPSASSCVVPTQLFGQTARPHAAHASCTSLCLSADPLYSTAVFTRTPENAHAARPRKGTCTRNSSHGGAFWQLRLAARSHCTPHFSARGVLRHT